jgi:histidine triad (HIT) family protein
VEKCVFCSIVEGSIPARIVREDERTLAFLDINPMTAGHTLVIPRRHAIDLDDVESDDLRAMTSAAHDVARRMRESLHARGVNWLLSSGGAAWQDVFHIHLHVIPRYDRHELQRPRPAAGVSADAVVLDEVQRKLKG